MTTRITTREAAAALGVSTRRIRALVADGRLTVTQEQTPRGAINWLDAAEVARFERLPAHRPKKPAAG